MPVFISLQLLGRTLRVDHVEEYKKPKEHGDEDDVTMKLRTDGCAPQIPDSPEHVTTEEEPLQVKVKVKKGTQNCDRSIRYACTIVFNTNVPH